MYAAPPTTLLHMKSLILNPGTGRLSFMCSCFQDHLYGFLFGCFVYFKPIYIYDVACTDENYKEWLNCLIWIYSYSVLKRNCFLLIYMQGSAAGIIDN